MATVNWEVSDLKREVADGFVYQVDFSLSASEGDQFVRGDARLTFPRPETLEVDYENLTQEIVIGWIKAERGSERVAAMEKQINDELALKVGSVQKSGVPWAVAPAE
jgi:hypothetical protein